MKYRIYAYYRLQCVCSLSIVEYTNALQLHVTTVYECVICNGSYI